MVGNPAITQTMGCPACGAPASAGFRFCAACGTPLTGAPAPAPGWVSSSAAPQRCDGCGHTGFTPDGYCTQCGQRGPTGPDHSEFDLGLLAGVTDIGHRHERNEDAFALGTLPGAALAVVCDGVSSSSRGDAAAHAAVDAALPVLATALSEGAHPERAIARAVGAAREAVAVVAGPDQGNPPSCTFVAGVVTAGQITVGWVGDSRAYWLPERGVPRCVTVDDSLANALIASGMAPDEAHAQPHSGALVRWLGIDADDGPPKVFTFAPEVAGRLIVCSDGLSRYRTAADALAASTPPGPPLAVARSLTQLALDAGGVDNIPVVDMPFPPPAPAEGSAS